MLAAAAIAALAAPAQAQASDACAYLSGLIPVDGGPLFLPSYPTAEEGPLRSVAFLYDDAVAAIALVGCGEAGRARRIGDAMLAALDHDRAWHDGRLRNGYAAGPVETPVKLGGWWDKTQNRWQEDRYQVSSDTGNMAWAMLALLSLDQALHDPRYRDGAVRIGGWVAGRGDRRGAGGYSGGFSGWEPSPAAPCSGNRPSTIPTSPGLSRCSPRRPATRAGMSGHSRLRVSSAPCGTTVAAASPSAPPTMG